MRRWAPALALALATSCARCSPPANVPVADAGPKRVHRTTDLRTAVLTAIPELRGPRIIEGSAVLRRTMVGAPTALETDARAGFAANGFVEEKQLPGERALAANKGPFRLEVEKRPTGAELRLSLPIHDADPGRMLAAPISITTEHMALMFPRPGGLETTAERFEVTIVYVAAPERAEFLVWQLVDVNTRGSWRLARVPEGFQTSRREDGGGGAVPEQVSLALEDTNTRARLTIDRNAGRVRLEYQLDTLALP